MTRALTVMTAAHVPGRSRMLAYLGTGPRDYAAKPVHVHPRGRWEFQAIVAGTAGPLLAQRVVEPHPPGARLWVFAPGCAHGWTAPPGAGCRVVVMHFSSASQAIQRAVAVSGYHSVALDQGAIARLDALARRLAQEISEPSDRGEILHQLALCEVSLLALCEVPPRRLQDAQELAVLRVESACAWFAEHMSSAPRFAALATATHVSPAHLRRLFWRVRGESPRTTLERLRYQRACELLADPTSRLETVAAACGLSAASALSRGFRAHTGFSPVAWRQRRLRPESVQLQPSDASVVQAKS
jgi:AraC-like DNA-binding protein